uniref:Uncharacterized protein n=1 Tax=Rhizophora mucronata TaxID=61149 RepID=A0A2P2NQY5_RHIMU
MAASSFAATAVIFWLFLLLKNFSVGLSLESQANVSFTSTQIHTFYHHLIAFVPTFISKFVS